MAVGLRLLFSTVDMLSKSLGGTLCVCPASSKQSSDSAKDQEGITSNKRMGKTRIMRVEDCSLKTNATLYSLKAFVSEITIILIAVTSPVEFSYRKAKIDALG